jgi:broad specificity phosphatase PhoE
VTTLLLVRHGQASFGAKNYDELSPLGHRQSEILGAHWRALGFAATAWRAGSMARQKSTGSTALKAMELTADLVEHAGFDEYDHQGLIRSYLPVIAAEEKDFAMSHRELFADRKLFQRFFEKVVGCWLDGREGSEPIKETWKAFCERSLQGINDAAAGGADCVVAFTSGGVIAAALQSALRLEGRVAFEMNWRIYNASVHHFRVGKRGLSLLGFNNVTHLELAKDPSLLTFR